MSEIGDTWKAVKEVRKSEKAIRAEANIQELKDNGIQFVSSNSGLHLLVESEHGTIDFWPTTGRFNVRSTKSTGFGIYALLRLCGVRHEHEE